MPPAASCGYGPNFEDRKSRISGSRSSRAFLSSVPGANADTTGVPSASLPLVIVQWSMPTVVR